MTSKELIEEYESFMNIKLSEREKIIFDYAYTVGKYNWDEEEEVEDKGEKAVKKEKIQWLLDNIDNIEIDKVYSDGAVGTPCLIIRILDYWEKAEEDKAPFEYEDSCIMYE